MALSEKLYELRKKSGLSQEQLAWGVVSVFMPSASERIGESSAVTLDGNGIFLIVSLAAVIGGAALLLKSSHDK
ncbi:MAG: hypothetical protein IJM17_00330 [Firmicutes bacterium]|nr:hypothetical protein [Bacillota bacterium]